MFVCTQSLYAQVSNDKELSAKEKRDQENAASNPAWYVLTQVAYYFNVGVYYSYLTPTGSFKQVVPSASAFSFDFGLDLTRMFGKNESDYHLILGLNADYTNFGKAKNPFSKTVADTTYELSVKNRLEVYSYYLELEYRKSFLCPFVSVAYSDLYMNPYKEVKTSTTNTSWTDGDYIGERRSNGVNIAAGLKCKYRFNNHRELMVLSRVSYFNGSAVDMIDLGTASLSPTGEVVYQTHEVNPTWFMYSVGIKYNF
jgi:hypothetical protein